MTTHHASPNLSAMMPETIAYSEILIKERDLDSFGHVNNASYLSILESIRWDVITQRGYGLDRIHQSKVGPVILEVSLKFLHEIRNRETIKIATGVLKTSNKITTLRQVMINAKGQEACVADFVLGLFDLKARKLIEYTPEWNRAIGLSNA